MIHPVFRLAAAQPLWLAEHAAAYASLVSEELVQGSARLQRRWSLLLAGAACLLVATTLAGVALMLWVALPALGQLPVAVFLLTPALPALVGVWALSLARGGASVVPFARLHQQLGQDLALLRQPGAP